VAFLNFLFLFIFIFFFQMDARELPLANASMAAVVEKGIQTKQTLN
jgi:hypothetical protein